MKRATILIFFILHVFTCFALGNSCSNPINCSLDSSEQTHTLNDTVLWFKFTGDGSQNNFVNIHYPLTETVATEITKIEFLKFDCVNQTLLEEWDWFVEDSMNIGHVVGELTNGTSYFIKVIRNNTNTSSIAFSVNHISTNNTQICSSGSCNLISNGAFDNWVPFPNINYPLVTNPFDPFAPYINCWYRAWGTPQIDPWGDFCFLWALNTNVPNSGNPPGPWGEAVITDNYLNIVPSNIYFLSYEIAVQPAGGGGSSFGPPLDHFYIGLTNTAINPIPPPGGGTGDYIPNYPITGQTIEHLTSVTNTSWVTHSLCFTANNNYTQLYFYPQMTTVNASATFMQIDNISLVRINNPIASNMIECGQSTTLSVACPISHPAVSYLWTPGHLTTSTITVSPTATTMYTLTTYVNGSSCCTTTGTVVVNPNSNAITITSSPAAVFDCYTSTITLEAPSGYTNYQWYNGLTFITSGPNLNSIDITSPGTYVLTATDGVCNYTAQITVTGTPPPTVVIHGSNILPCVPHSTILTAVGNGLGSSATYSWNTGANTAPISATNPGIYQVTYSLGNCSTSASLTVINAPAPAITLSPSSAIYCGGFPPVFLTPNCPTCVSISGTYGAVSPSTNITYTVTGTNSYGCTATAQATVYPFDPRIFKPIIVGAESNCLNAGSNTYTYTISNWNSALGAYYTWSATNSNGSQNNTIIFNSNSPSATITWNSAKGGTITVSMGTNVNGCLVTTTFYVQDCCAANNFGLTLKDGDDVDDITTAAFTNLPGIVFNGTFYVNRDFEFRAGCGILGFAPGSRMVVRPGVTVSIDGCYLRPGDKCCQMWKGIELEQGTAASRIILTNSEVHQAVNGITIPAGTRYTLDNSKFINNYNGLNITGTPGSNVAMSNLQFYSTSFACTPTNIFTNFADPYLGQTLLPGTYGYAGIQAKNCTNLDIGNWLQTANANIHFYNLANGIIYTNSNVRIWNCTFKHMKYDVQYPNTNTTKNNCAVNGTGGSIKFTGLGGLSSSPNTIEDCKYGIALTRTRGEITQLKTTYDVIRNIDERTCFKLEIHHNYLRGSTVNIYSYGNYPNIGMHIYKNFMKLAGSALFGSNIELIEFSFNPHLIEENFIYVFAGKRGINTTGVRGSRIIHNYLQLSRPQNKECIYMSNSHDNFVICNTAEATSTPTGLMQSGIYLNSSQKNEIVDNTVNKTNMGFRFNVNCNNTIWKGNSMYDHDYGLYFDPNGEFGQQPQLPGINNGNLWLGSYNISGAFLNPSTFLYAGLNRIFYNVNGSNNIPPSSNDPDPNGPNAWFKDNTDPDYTSPSTCTVIPAPINFFENEDEINAQNNNSGSGDPTSGYCNDRFLFRKLEEDPSLMSNNPILQAFYSQNLYGNIGLYTDVEIKIEDAIKWDVLYQMTFMGNENLKLSKLDSIRIIDSLMVVDPVNQSYFDLVHNDLLASIDNIEASNSNLLHIISQIKEYRIANAEMENSNLIDYSLNEQNEIIVNEIYLATVARENLELSSSQINDLEQIIGQCPLIGGPSVFKARALYRMYDQEIYWDDDLICPAYGVSPRLAARNVFENIKISVFPNPASNVLFMTYNIPQESKVEFILYNIYGQELVRKSLNTQAQQETLDISNLVTNLYIYKIKVDGNTIREEKMSVIK